MRRALLSGLCWQLRNGAARRADGPVTQKGKPIKVREAYDREFERYLVRMFLEQQPHVVATFLDSAGAKPASGSSPPRLARTRAEGERVAGREALAATDAPAGSGGSVAARAIPRRAGRRRSTESDSRQPDHSHCCARGAADNTHPARCEEAHAIAQRCRRATARER